MIKVLSENGTPLAPTYPKRAKGLVKSGRARFVGDDTIVLTGGNSTTSPPSYKDTKMNNNSHNDNDTIVEANADMLGSLTVGAANPDNSAAPEWYKAEKPLPPADFTVEYVLSRLDSIIADTSYIKSALDGVINMSLNESPNGGLGDAERAKAARGMVADREQTNQQVITLLTSMLYALKPEMSKPMSGEDELKRIAAQTQSQIKVKLAESLSNTITSVNNYADNEAIDITLARCSEMLDKLGIKA